MLVNWTLGSNDNEGFLEHFRYQIIASQLLNEDASFVTSPTASSEHCFAQAHLPELTTTTTTGACVATALAFVLVWIWKWARIAATPPTLGTRTFLASMSTMLLFGSIWVYTTRRSLLYLRRNVIDTTTTFTTNLQSLNTSSSSVLALIQEVELVSRGYRMYVCVATRGVGCANEPSRSQPLPPITRIDGADKPRKALQLRRSLHSGYASLIPGFIQAIQDIRPYVDQDHVERFLDVYEVPSADIKDALLGLDSTDVKDAESLRSLKNDQARYSTLRRLLLCSLLSLQATGGRSDASKWQLATTVLQRIACTTGDLSQRFIKLLDDEVQPGTPIEVKRRRTISAREQPAQHSRVESQVRRISTLSTGIRSLQAKIYLLREESTRALSDSTSEPRLTEVINHLREQYDGLGVDLQALMEAWETGKQALARDISRQERRMSQPNSSDPSRISHQSGSSDSFCVQNETKSTDVFPPIHGPGRAPLSPPVTEDGSDGHSVDEEIFEAISSPRVRERSTLTRNERITRAKEERERLAVAREKREASANLVKELQSVIKLRPAMRTRRPETHNRVSSL